MTYRLIVPVYNAAEFSPPEFSCCDVYAQSQLVVSGYSSAVFDFSPLRKPIIYTQFGMKFLFSGEHICTKGYFDYEPRGFGEVVHDPDSTIQKMIEYMENGRLLKEDYRSRIDRFLRFRIKVPANEFTAG